MNTKILKSLQHPSDRITLGITLFALLIIVFISITILSSLRPNTIDRLVLLFIILSLSILISIAVFLEIYSARLMGNALKVSKYNFPHINDAYNEMKTILDIKEDIEIFIYENGSFNAIFFPILRRKFILINSEVLHTAESTNEVKWLIGRFLGSYKARSYQLGYLQVIINGIEKIRILNIIFYPYERAVVKSGDRIGLYLVDGDINSAVNALARSLAGAPLAKNVNIYGILQQDKDVKGSFFGFISKCLSQFPHQTSRISELLIFTKHYYPKKFDELNARYSASGLDLNTAL